MAQSYHTAAAAPSAMVQPCTCSLQLFWGCTPAAFSIRPPGQLLAQLWLLSLSLFGSFLCYSLVDTIFVIIAGMLFPPLVSYHAGGGREQPRGVGKGAPRLADVAGMIRRTILRSRPCLRAESRICRGQREVVRESICFSSRGGDCACCFPKKTNIWRVLTLPMVVVELNA